MNKLVFHRMLGAIIIGLMVVVLLPLWFDGANVDNLMGEGFRIQPEDVKTVNLGKQVNDAQIEQAEATLENVAALHENPDMAEVSPSQIEAIQQPPAKLTKNQAESQSDTTWTLWVATHENHSSTRAQQNQLKKAGFLTYYKTSEDDNGKILYRVYAGPFMTVDQAEKAQKQIHQLLGRDDSFLQKYIP